MPGVTEGSGDLCANQVRHILEKARDIRAVIAVPYVAPPGFRKQVRQACDGSRACEGPHAPRTGLRRGACDAAAENVLGLVDGLCATGHELQAVVSVAHLLESEQHSLQD